MNSLQFGGLTSTCCLNWLKKLSAKCAHIFNPYRMCQCGALAHIFEPLVDEFGIIFMQGDRVLFINCVLVVVCWPQAGIGWLNLDTT